MRTTLDIPDRMYRALKARAAKQGCSVKELILRSVEKEVKSSSRRRSQESESLSPEVIQKIRAIYGLPDLQQEVRLKRKGRIKLPIVRSKQPGTLRLTNESLRF